MLKFLSRFFKINWNKQDLKVCPQNQLEALLSLYFSNKLHEALDSLEQLINNYPDDSFLWHIQGGCLHKCNQLKEAQRSYKKALSINPDNAESYNNLAVIYREIGEFDAALINLTKSLKINPTYVEAYSNLGLVYKNTANYHLSIINYNKAISISPDFSEAWWNLSLVQLLLGNYQEGWVNYEWRWKKDDFETREYKQPLWDGSSLTHKTLFIYCEQGFGDAIQFIRYLKILSKPSITLIVECHSSLYRLFSTLPEIDTLVSQGDLLPDFDVHIPLMSLPRVFQTTLETIPVDTAYLFHDHSISCPLVIDPEPYNIGIVWAGRPAHHDDKNRSLEVSFFSPLVKLSGTQFYSLQMGDRQSDLSQQQDLSPIIDCADLLHDYADTATIIDQLDLVITVDTSVAHLAAALGKPVWVLLPFAPDWRWLLDRDDSPWYRSARLFRQSERGDWASVFQSVQTALVKQLKINPNEQRLFNTLTSTINAFRQDNSAAGNSLLMVLLEQLELHSIRLPEVKVLALNPLLDKALNNLENNNHTALVDVLENEIAVILKSSEDLPDSDVITIDAEPTELQQRLDAVTALYTSGDIDGTLVTLDQLMITYPEQAFLYNLQGACFYAQEQYDIAITSYQKAIALNPEFAEALNGLGLTQSSLGENNTAIISLKKAIALKPHYPEAFNNLGNCYSDLNNTEEAILNYKKALSIKTDYMEVYFNLGNLFKETGHFNEAIKYYQITLDLNPNSFDSYNNIGNTFNANGQFKSALNHYQKAINVNPNFAEAWWNLSLVQLLLGNYQEGWLNYEWRLRKHDFEVRGYKQPLWDGSSLTDKTLFIYCEQGFGDTIQFIRYLKILSKPSVTLIVECHSSLYRLFSTLPEIDTLISQGDLLPDFDVHISLMSLPRIFQTTLETIPVDTAYLFHDHSISCPLVIDPEPYNIGIVWAGRPAHQNDKNRSLEVSFFASLVRLPGTQFYSLQMGDRQSDLSQQQDLSPIIDCADLLHDYADTATIIDQLDLVITVDTSVAHLAAALGKPVWVLLPFAPDWRWLLDRDDSPWYRSARLFRQSERGDWASVFQSVQTALVKQLKINPNEQRLFNTLTSTINAFRQDNSAAGNSLLMVLLEQLELHSIRLPEVKVLALNPLLDKALNNLENNNHTALVDVLENEIAVILKSSEDLPDSDVITIDAEPTELQQRLDAVTALYTSGDIDGTLVTLDQLMITYPEQAFLYNLQGACFYAQEQYDIAITSYQKAIELNPEFAEAHNNLGNILKTRGHLKDALKSYQAALSINPDFTEGYYNLGVVYKELGELKTAVEYYEKAIEIKPDYAEAQNNLGLVLNDLGQFDLAILNYNKAITYKPNFFQAYNNLGLSLNNIEMFKEALESFQLALNIFPDYSDAYFNVGITYYNLGDVNQAIEHYKIALKISPQFAKAYCNLGIVFREIGEFDAALECYQTALQINPKYTEVYNNLGIIYYDMRDLGLSIVNYKKAISLTPDYIDPWINLSFSQLVSGDLKEGWINYERRRNNSAYNTERPYTYPFWLGQTLTNKTILITGEQGIGDEVMFASCIPDLIAQKPKQIILDCCERLEPAFRQSFPDILFMHEANHNKIDFQTPIGSLPQYLRSDFQSFPATSSYLTANPQLVRKWKKRYSSLGKGLKIGISWKGGSNNFTKKARSINLANWNSILLTKGHFINLQYGDCADEISGIKKLFGVKIHDWSDADSLTDLENFSAQIAALDLVISIDNSTLHFAGALGKPVWALLPFASDWRWFLELNSSLWYSNMRLFRQRDNKQWNMVLDEVKKALIQFDLQNH